ncbi:hypothetical protein DE146DRAFT_72878 [Phaeosphaeria sp. MPI-PUGE-AT-0046c]|nr:hypothetical protein DE146DRAFT_72878 [Phaeosphaeria sp. MPI-PUGE-AT-0046c]
MPKLYYFRAPTFDLNPDSDIAPKLGSILPHLDRLTTSLNQSNEYHISDNLKNASAHNDYQEHESKGIAASVGLDTSALQGLAGTATAFYTFAKDTEHTYSCEKLETLEFEPDNEYINNAIVASPRVQRFLERAFPGRKRVYMITGLKIATGFRRSSAMETSHGPGLAVGADAVAVGVPVGAGVETGVERNGARTIAHGETANKIVFAYRVVKIKARRDGLASFKHKSGGKYSMDDEGEDNGEEGRQWVLDSLADGEFERDYPETVAVEMISSQ